LIENPAFDSQTKETMTSKKERFGSTCPLPEAFVNTVLESGILQALQEWSKALGQSELAQYLNRSDMGLQKKLFGIPKLEDANKAGTKDGGECTLILTEGDSAKALAVAGFGVIGRDLYGVFPLRGKLRNVRDLTVKQMLENREIDQIMRILALDASKSYDSVRGLRYGSIMIMTDQDPDGSHIKGLIINFLHYWFPSLLRIPGFLKEFVTPIVKMTKNEQENTFFTIPEYDIWKKDNNDGHGWKCKYYKGLGTSTSAEAREYFAALEDHEMIFTHEGAEDDDLIDMAFNHSRADDRKGWISRCQPGTYLDHTQATLSYNEFVNKELVLFAQYDVSRMIPSVVDGFKPGQRKVLFGCFKRRAIHDIKVAQLTGYVAEQASYHHGETSLQGTIIGMAQTFVGSNNINLLVPSGQFGTRLTGGKDHAAARYIFTRLSKATRCIFPEEDDAVLEYLNDEGSSIEPKFYCPIIPMIAANGADGIGVGWSCTVPNFNPRELIANVRRFLKGKELLKQMPWYKGFTGTISEIPDSGKYECCGTVTKRGRTRLEITELPVRRWTQDYKEWLLEQLPKDAEHRAQITDVREYHTENSVHFVLGIAPDKMTEADRKGLQKTFHLKSSITTTNMWLFDPNGRIKKYESVEEIIKDFATVRLDLYGKRKAHQLSKMKRQLDLIDNKLRFIQLVVNETLEIDGRKSQMLCNDMRKHRLKHKRDIDGVADGPEVLSLQEEMGPLGYKYLINMKLWTLTDDRLQDLKRQHQEKTLEIEGLEGTTLEELWERDLAKLDLVLDQLDREDAKDAEAAAKLAKKHLAADMEGLVNKQCVLVLTQDFKAKRVKTSEWKAQRKGRGLNRKGIIDKKRLEEAQDDDDAEAELEKEALRDVFCCHDFDALLVFTEEGNVFSMQALDVPAAKNVRSKATPIKEFLPDIGDEHVAAIVTVPQKALRDQSDEFVVLVSAEGLAKKVCVDKFRALETNRKASKKGLQCFKFTLQGDKLKWALRGSNNSALVMVTSEGFALRTSMGEDWRPAAPRGAGKKAIRVTSKAGRLASCCVSEMTPQEIQKAEEAKAKAAALSAEKKAAAVASAELVAAGGVAPQMAAPFGRGRPKKLKVKNDADDDDSGNEGDDIPKMPEVKNEADDDDSENEGDDAEDAQDPEANESDGAESEGEEDVDMTDGGKPLPQAGSEPEKAVGAEETATQVTLEKSDWGTCLLMLTEDGMGMRVPLTHKRLQIMRKGRAPSRVMKIGDSDDLIGACIVTGKVEQKKPELKGKPFPLWYAENKAIIQADILNLTEEKKTQMEGEASSAEKHIEENVLEGDAENDATTAGNVPIGFLAMQIGRKRFNELPPSEMEALEKRCEMDRDEYEKLMEEFKTANVPSEEQVMVASKCGFISRVMVDTVPVVNKNAGTRGARIVKVKGRNDALSSISLLGAMDEVDEAAVDAAPAPVEAVAAEADDEDMEDEDVEPNEGSQTTAKMMPDKMPATDIAISSINSVPRPSLSRRVL